MFERFTVRARAVVVEAQQQARNLGDTEIRAEHLLLALLSSPTGVCSTLGLERDAVLRAVQAARPDVLDAEALSGLGVDLTEVRRRAEDAFGPGALDQPVRRRRGLLRRYSTSTGGNISAFGHLPFTRPAKQALAASLRAAVALEDSFIGPDHLLLGLLADDKGPATTLVRRLGLDPAGLRAEVTAQRRVA